MNQGALSASPFVSMRLAGVAALLATLAYVGIVASGVLGFIDATQYFALAAHLLLFPVVSALTAPEWARGAGYGWLVVDNIMVVAALEKIPVEYIEVVRHGLHVATAVWVLGASMSMSGLRRIVGLVAAAGLIVMSLAEAHLPYAVSRVTLLCFLVWLAWSGFQLLKSHKAKP